MKILLTFIAFATINLHAQDGISFSVSHDVKLLTLGDNHGNKSGTTDLIFDMNWEGKQFEWYYFFIQTQFEYANLYGGDFYRYSVHGMWALNRLLIPKLEASIGLGLGIIHRGKELQIGGLGSYSTTGELCYPILKDISLVAKYEIVYRSDLVELYNERQKLKPNFAIGIKIKKIRF